MPEATAAPITVADTAIIEEALLMMPAIVVQILFVLTAFASALAVTLSVVYDANQKAYAISGAVCFGCGVYGTRLCDRGHGPLGLCLCIAYRGIRLS